MKRKSIAQQLGECEGKWVAIDGDRLVACGKSLQEVEKKAHKTKVKNPILFVVPKVSDGSGYY